MVWGIPIFSDIWILSNMVLVCDLALEQHLLVWLKSIGMILTTYPNAVIFMCSFSDSFHTLVPQGFS